ncbi:MAG: riboflavin synthase [Fidelibacterota bacterium]
MFTGLIEEIGSVRQVLTNSEGRLFTITAEKVLEGLSIGESVAVDGVCLSAVEVHNDGFVVQAVRETIACSTLVSFRVGTKVNLERASRAGDRLGGHFVQGHVDGVAVISGLLRSGQSASLDLNLPADLMKYVIAKGSIAVNGISLTVAERSGTAVSIALIPLTLRETNLGLKKPGDYVNIEVDMMAKYIEQLLPRSEDEVRDIERRIRNWGYDK